MRFLCLSAKCVSSSAQAFERRTSKEKKPNKMLLYCSLALLILNGVSAQRRPLPIPSPQRPAPQQQNSDILELISESSPDGSFHTKWSTANGISVEERGQPKNLGNNEIAEEVQGSASWTSPEGEQVSLTWRADENGAVFQGDHVPTAPPIPALIQRALDYIAANPPKSSQEGAYVVDADQIAGPLKPTASRRPRF